MESCPDLNSNEKKQFFSQVKLYYWEGPYLYKTYGDGIIWRYLPKKEIHSLIFPCHDSTHGGYATIDKIAAKILQIGFY